MFYTYLSLFDQINLVLQDEDVLQLHDLDGSKMFTGLWLRTRLISSDEEQGCVHHRGAVQHGGHENVVTRTVHEGNMTHQAVLESVHGECVLFRGTGGSVTNWSLTFWIIRLVYLSIGITELDGDVPLQLVLEPDGVDPGQGLDYCRLSMSHMTNGSNINCSLSGDDLNKVDC
jgi:hypothetical protein